jgi:glycerophosphoryl diester phosphodiesterase
MTLAVWFVLLALAILIWTGPLWRPRGLPGVTRARPWALGHRGVRGSLPENTVAAFRAALDAGLDGLETDVQRTRDGTLVLVHDFRVAGLRVCDASEAELRAAVPPLATLAELLALVRERPGTLLNVELKTVGWNDRRLAAAVATALVASGLGDRLVVSSFSFVALLRFRLRAPSIRTAYLWSEDPRVPWPGRRPWPAPLLHADALHPHHPAVTPERVARWKRRGLMVNTWTVNEPGDAARVLAAGVDGVMGDDPDALLRALGRAT